MSQSIRILTERTYVVYQLKQKGDKCWLIDKYFVLNNVSFTTKLIEVCATSNERYFLLQRHQTTLQLAHITFYSSTAI